MPLTLDLLRHGAVLAAADGDAVRLSPRGQRDLERLALRLVGLDWRPDAAFTSPLARARDSARIVLRHAAPDLRPALLDALRPEGDPGEVVERLAAFDLARAHVLLVSHQPLLGALAQWLAGGEVAPLMPGEMARIEFAGALAAGTGRPGWRSRPEDRG